MNAKLARMKANENCDIILKEIYSQIEKACKKSEYSIVYSNQNKICEKVRETLIKEGYTVEYYLSHINYHCYPIAW